MSTFTDLQALVNGMQKDFEKFYEKGNKSAGTRIRAHMQTLKKKAQEIRNNVQDLKNEAAGK